MLVPVINLGNGVAVLYFDVDATDTVTSIRLENNVMDRELFVDVTRPSGRVRSLLAPAGATTVDLPRGRQFSHLSETKADWSVSLSLRWP